MRKISLHLLLISSILLSTTLGFAKPLESFSKAKKILAEKYEAIKTRETFYCGCKFKGKKLILNFVDTDQKAMGGSK